MDESKFTYYKDLFEKVQDNLIREGNKLDRIVLLISTGSIVLSVNFVFSSDADFKFQFLLLFSWVFFVLTILLNFISLLICHRRFKFLLEKLEKWKNDEFKADNFDTITKHSKWISIFNIASYLTLLGGIIFIVLWGSNNLYIK